MSEISLFQELSGFYTGKTRLIFGRGESLKLRTHIKNMIEDLREYFYIEEELFLIVSKSVTETNFYKNFLLNTKPAEVIICDYQDPGLLELAEIYSRYRKNRKRIIVGMGGGSIMDLAKSTAGWAYHTRFIPAFPIVSEGLPCYPLILMPTLAGSGSEASPYIVMTDKQGCKVTNGLIPAYMSVIDPLATVSAPLYETLYAALIAFSQSVEAFVSTNASEETKLYSYKAIELIIYYLARVLKNKEDEESRSYLSLASMFSGISKRTGLGLTTSIGQQVSNLPYGLIVALLLPAVIKFNYPLCEEEYDKINNLFLYRAENLADTIQSWFDYLGVYSFEGIYRKNIENFLQSEYCMRLATQLVLENLHYNTNPRKADEEEIKKLIFSLYTIPIQSQNQAFSHLF